MTRLPTPRGPLSEWLTGRLPASLTSTGAAPRPTPPVHDALSNDDVQLALWMCYELHYRGFQDVPDDREWALDVLTFRSTLEQAFLAELQVVAPLDAVTPGRVAGELQALAAVESSRSLSRFLQRDATLPQFREFVMHRSVYHLKEADPHTWLIPRLAGVSKAAVVEIQTDEYGGGRAERMHAALYADLMRGMGLDVTYGVYLDAVPGVTLAISNLMSLFGLHRAWRGAAAGHLAAFELTSSLPNKRYAMGLRRLGGTAQTCTFYHEHVEADAVHEQIAVHDLCVTLAHSEPWLAPSIIFGARCALVLDELFADHVLDYWQTGRSSLITDPQLATA